MRSRSGTIWSNGRTKAYHFSLLASWAVCGGGAELLAGEPLVPQMLEQNLGQIPLGLRPLPVGFANGEVHLDHQRAVQIVHQRDELVSALRNPIGILLAQSRPLETYSSRHSSSVR